MIIHSTKNLTDDSCLVQVEGIEPGYAESSVVLFATGAAAKHNASWQVRHGAVTEWLTDDGRPLDPSADTTDASAARVLCKVEATTSADVRVYCYLDSWCVVCDCGHHRDYPTRYEADQHATHHRRVHASDGEAP